MPPLIAILHPRPSSLIRNLISPRAKVVPLLQITSRPKQKVVPLLPLANVITIRTMRPRAALGMIVLPQQPPSSGSPLPIPPAPEVSSSVHSMSMVMVASTGADSSNIYIRSLSRHHVGKALPGGPSAGVPWSRVFWPDIANVRTHLLSLFRLG